jgi:C4-dicarboxylate-specific signal transduction histidine kinase
MRLVALFNLGFVLVVAYLAVRNRASQSKFFLVAFAGYGLFIFVFLLSLFRLIPFSFIVQYAIHFGLLFNIIVLSIGLAMRLFRKFNYSIELERSQKAEVSMKNEELERLIAERTSEINEKQLELRSIIDNSDNLIWLISRNYEVMEFNQGFGVAWQLTYNKELIKNTSILDQIDNPAERKKWKKRYDKVFAGKSFNFTESYEIAGKHESFETNVYPIREERLAYEQELKNKNIALQQVNDELDSFVYSASHDLKAPLASIQGLIGLVRQEKNEKSRSDYYEMMDKSIKRLDQFIRDIIDYSRNTRIELKREEINLQEMIQSVLEDLKFMSSGEFDVNINANDEYPLVTDPTRLRIIFRNLLSNALAYGVKEGDIPHISIRWNIKKTKAIFEICDMGPGIPDEHKDLIFDMFYRANESSSGSGLGLYIVRESVKKMNGSVSVDSSAAGTCFRVALPNLTNK